MRWAALLAAAGAACTNPPPIPGDQIIGSFAFETRLLPTPDGGCPLGGMEEVGDGGLGPSNFTATISVRSSDQMAFLTVDGYDHRGTLVGDQLEVSARALAKLKGACAGDYYLEETIRARLVREDLAQAAGSCEGLDGAVAPASDGGSPDAAQLVMLVCGTLTDSFSTSDGLDGGCSCTLDYAVSGTRQ